MSLQKVPGLANFNSAAIFSPNPFAVEAPNHEEAKDHNINTVRIQFDESSETSFRAKPDFLVGQIKGNEEE